LKPVDAARHWLARQIAGCPTRLDGVRRSKLFQEVEAATSLVDSMDHHSLAIYDSNHWCSYEVFLKAARRLLSEEGRLDSTVGAVVLI